MAEDREIWPLDKADECLRSADFVAYYWPGAWGFFMRWELRAGSPNA